jgi:hypothetical protein
MKKQKAQPQDNIWDTPNQSTTETVQDKVTETFTEKVEEVVKVTKATQPQSLYSAEYDLEGLMTDFPTARDLERFVYDETGIVLNLKGRANKLKYQVAMDVLNGVEVDEKFLGDNNPYIDKTEMVPVEDLKPVPARSKDLPPRKDVQNSFYSPFIPHPDEAMRAQDKKVQMIFRKYTNGMISYEILGPLAQRPSGEKINKYGKVVPEIIKWIDPRTGEQVVMREDGSLTPQGKRLRALMQTKRVNKTNQWDVWIDREFVSLGDIDSNNVWDLNK